MVLRSWALLIAVALAGGMATGQEGLAAKPAAGQEPPTTQRKPSNRALRGEIVSVDIEAKTLTVQTKRGGEVSSVVIETGPETQFLLDQAPATLVDLRRGMKVMVLPDVGLASKVSATTVKNAPRRTGR